MTMRVVLSLIVTTWQLTERAGMNVQTNLHNSSTQPLASPSPPPGCGCWWNLTEDSTLVDGFLARIHLPCVPVNELQKDKLILYHARNA